MDPRSGTLLLSVSSSWLLLSAVEQKVEPDLQQTWIRLRTLHESGPTLSDQSSPPHVSAEVCRPDMETELHQRRSAASEGNVLLIVGLKQVKGHTGSQELYHHPESSNVSEHEHVCNPVRTRVHVIRVCVCVCVCVCVLCPSVLLVCPLEHVQPCWRNIPHQ